MHLLAIANRMNEGRSGHRHFSSYSLNSIKSFEASLLTMKAMMTMSVLYEEHDLHPPLLGMAKKVQVCLFKWKYGKFGVIKIRGRWDSGWSRFEVIEIWGWQDLGPPFLTVFGCFWPFLAIFAILAIMVFFGHFHPFQSISNYFQPFLAIFGQFWLFWHFLGFITS